MIGWMQMGETMRGLLGGAGKVMRVGRTREDKEEEHAQSSYKQANQQARHTSFVRVMQEEEDQQAI
jgi:hypothetical protein